MCQRFSGHFQVPTLAAPAPPPKNNRFLTAEGGQRWSGLQWENKVMTKEKGRFPANPGDLYFNLSRVDLAKERLRISLEAEHGRNTCGNLDGAKKSIGCHQEKIWKHDYLVGRNNKKQLCEWITLSSECGGLPNINIYQPQTNPSFSLKYDRWVTTWMILGSQGMRGDKERNRNSVGLDGTLDEGREILSSAAILRWWINESTQGEKDSQSLTKKHTHLPIAVENPCFLQEEFVYQRVTQKKIFTSNHFWTEKCAPRLKAFLIV